MSSATNIVGCIPDDPNTVRIGVPVGFSRGFESGTGDVVSRVVVISITAKGEEMLELKMRQLTAGPCFDIPSQKPQSGERMGRQFFQDLLNAGQDFAHAFW